MHILIIPSWYPTKDNPINGVFFREQAHALLRAGHKVGVIYPQRTSLRQFRLKGDEWSRGIANDDDDGLPTLRLSRWNWYPKMPNAHVRLLIKDAISLYKDYIRNYGKPDIIHAHSILFGGVWAANIHEFSGIPFVVTEHSTAFARGLIEPWQKKYLKLVFGTAERIITVSPELGDLLKKAFECSPQLLQAIPNIVNTDFFYAKQRTKQASEPFIFLTVSLLTQKKGQRFLLEAFAERFKGNDKVLLWIGGDGEEREHLEEQVELLEIKNQVNFLGPLSRIEVCDAMQSCDAFILPSLYETFGVVLIEAIACGKPVIATRCGGPECIVSKINGYLVAKGDINELGTAMERMIINAEKFDTTAIRRDCIERFSEKAVTDQLTQLYNTILRDDCLIKEKYI